jgi:hypothetical protein
MAILTQDTRPSKRQKLEDDIEDVDILPPHPLGVRPEGNAYTDDSSFSVRQKSGHFASLSDELTMHLLEYLDAHTLLSFGSTCKTLYGFAHYDELWKSLFIQK